MAPLPQTFEHKFGEPLLSVFWKTLHAQLAEAVGRYEIATTATLLAVSMYICI